MRRPAQVALVTLALLGGLAACRGGGKAAPTTTTGPPSPFATTDSGAATSSSSTNAVPVLASLHPGLCFDADSFQVGAPIDPRAMRLSLCAGPHQHEVYAVFTHPDGRSSPWPGDDVLDAWANDHCLAAFADYVGIEYEQSTLDVATVHPDEADWSVGDRTVACAVHDADFALMTGSVKASAK
jgi:hypothetical protein